MARADLGQTSSRRWVMVAMALTAMAGAAALYWHWERENLRQEGQAIFEGRTQVQAKLAGQDTLLPVMATRCVNCHATQQKTPWVDPSVSTPPPQQTFASPLSATWLTVPRMRHGGPESVYDPAGLCRLLRDGVDAGQVMISSSMPRFNATDAQCAALWAHLNTL